MYCVCTSPFCLQFFFMLSQAEPPPDLFPEKGHAADDQQGDQQPGADHQGDEGPLGGPRPAEVPVHADLHPQAEQGRCHDAQHGGGQDGPPSAPQEKAQAEHHHAGHRQNGQGQMIKPILPVNPQGDQVDIHPHRRHIQGQPKEHGHPPGQQGQHEPDPQHHGPADHIQPPGVSGGQQQVQQAAAEGHAHQHGGEDQGQAPLGGGLHHGGLGGKVGGCRRGRGRVPHRRLAQGTHLGVGV